MILANTLIDMPAEARKSEILNSAGIAVTDDELERSRKLAAVINSFVDDYFELAIEKDTNRDNGSVLLPDNLRKSLSKEISVFKPLAITALRKSAPSRDTIIANPENVYQLAGAVKLSAANKATRNLSTTMGLLWERIANISPYAINPETEFNIKIKGVDLISQNMETRKIEYQQLKTQRNTLTGSQKERSIAELSLHENPVFCACFSLGSWTFNHVEIPRISGEQFWQRIGIDYEIFERAVKDLMIDLEKIFVGL